jgi:hypothetical protein
MIPIVTPQGQPLNWDINGNGGKGNLVINQIDPNDSSLQGVVFDNDAIVGFWDDAAQKITFIRASITGDPEESQIYTGYLFQKQLDGLTTKFTLTGYFEAFKKSGGTAQRNLFGWFAQATIIRQIPAR